MLTLVGKQGIGKSTLFDKLGGEWFSDTLTDIKGKEAYEALDGVWIMEMAELKALRKQEREAVKNYISKRVDTYRKAFERNVTVNKRQCIFIGTTNDRKFLDDPTGNRRFWVVDVDITKATKTVWDDLTEEVRNQIWAEAVELFRSGENINRLSETSLKEASELQQSHSEDNDLLGLIEEYLKIPLPSNWNLLGIQERRQWISATSDYRDDNKLDKKERTKVSAIEVWCECLQKNEADITKGRSREINECLDKIPGWKPCGLQRFGPYGHQRGYGKC